MAVYFEKPRITVEESPWTAVLQSLPDMFLAFHQANQQQLAQEREYEFRADEAEKNRQFKEDAMYAENLMVRENTVLASLMELENEAADFGYNIEEPMNKLRNSPYYTAGGQDKLLNLSRELRERKFEDLQNVRRDILDQKNLFSQGGNIASFIDINQDNIASSQELVDYQEQLRIEQGDSEYILPESLIRGVRYNLNDPDNRLARLQYKTVESAEERAVSAEERAVDEATRQQLGFETELDIIKKEEVRAADKFEMEKKAFTSTEKRLAAEEKRAVSQEVRAKSEFEMNIMQKYNELGITPMTGTYTNADFGLSSQIYNEFRTLSKPQIFAMIENTPQAYDDLVPGDIDISDFENAIAPTMAGVVGSMIADNPDIMALTGITAEDVVNKTDKFANIVSQGVANAMAGFEQNPNYRIKSDIELTQAKVYEQESLQITESEAIASFQSSASTIKGAIALYVDDDGDVKTTEAKALAQALFNLGTAKPSKEEQEKIEDMIKVLSIQGDDPTVIASIIKDKDYRKLMSALGLGELSRQMEAASSKIYKSKQKYKPKRRITQQQATDLERQARESAESELQQLSLDLVSARNPAEISTILLKQKQLREQLGE